MGDTLKLMAILAHPDDDSLGFGGILAKSAAEHVETHLVTATRGEYGWTGNEQEYSGLAALGDMREAELQAAAQVPGDPDRRALRLPRRRTGSSPVVRGGSEDRRTYPACPAPGGRHVWP